MSSRQPVAIPHALNFICSASIVRCTSIINSEPEEINPFWNSQFQQRYGNEPVGATVPEELIEYAQQPVYVSGTLAGVETLPSNN